MSDRPRNPITEAGRRLARQSLSEPVTIDQILAIEDEAAALSTPPPSCTFPGCSCDGTMPAIPTDPTPPPSLDAAMKDRMTALAHWSPEDWQERGRGADPIARTINACRDIVDEVLGGR